VKRCVPHSISSFLASHALILGSLESMRRPVLSHSGLEAVQSAVGENESAG